MASTPAAVRPRLTSLDQFRGYTMFGMLLVNFLGGYAVCPKILKHSHDYCSYADTIMPQFLFAAGFAMRLSLGRRMEAGGHMPWGRAVRRILGLALVAIAWYSFCDLHGVIERFSKEDTVKVLLGLAKRGWFQTLMHIAVTSLWILPVIVAPARVRVAYAILSAGLHIGLSWWFNFHWVNADPSGIDGGPLGFLTWAVPALCGTLACDAVRASGVAATGRLALSGLLVMLLGWVMTIPTTLYNYELHDETPASALYAENHTTELKPRPLPKHEKLAPDPVFPSLSRLQNWDGTLVEPPFVPPPNSTKRQWNYWMMSQRCGNLAYPTFAAGVSLLIYAGFLWACDGMGWRLGLFRTLGTNSLAAYILHDVAGWIMSWVDLFPEKTSTGLMAAAAFACFTLIVYAGCRTLEALGWYIRV